MLAINNNKPKEYYYYCSMSGHRVASNPATSFYSATKFAVTALTEGLRKELRDQKSNIKITVSLLLCIQY